MSEGEAPTKAVLVGSYSFAFLKQGDFFFPFCLQKLCGNDDLSASMTSQHFEEQSVSDILLKQLNTKVCNIHIIKCSGLCFFASFIS